MVELTHVGIIGAGQMGSGIAQVCAAAGVNVSLVDVSDSRSTVSIRRGPNHSLQEEVCTVSATLTPTWTHVLWLCVMPLDPRSTLCSSA